MSNRYKNGGLGYGTAKKELLEKFEEYFKPFREKRLELESDLGEVANIMKKGAEKTRVIANKNLDKIKKAVGLNYY